MKVRNLCVQGCRTASVLVVTDAPGKTIYDNGETMPHQSMQMFGAHGEQLGFRAKDFVFVTPCPPIPPEVAGSDKREGEFIKQFHNELVQLVATLPNVRLVVTLGVLPAKQVLNRAVQITKIRGQVLTEKGWDVPILPLFAPGHIFRRPELQKQFVSDFKVIRVLADNNWDSAVLEQFVKKADYKYVFDLSDWLTNKPKGIGLDIESKGGRWYEPTFRVLCVQLTRRSGQTIVVPLYRTWFNQEVNSDLGELTLEIRGKLVEQLKELLGDPNVAVTGSNLSSDILGLRKIGIHVANWKHDTMQLAFVNDENMREKGLDEVTRRWVPEMAGYADDFNREVDKDHMETVLPSKMLPYAGGDPDASFRATRRLAKLGMEDPRNWNCYERVQMPALRTFVKMEEYGIRIDRKALRALGKVLRKDVADRYDHLIKQVAPSIKAKHVDVGLTFSRANFVVDILFDHPEGLKLTPLVYTKGTKALKGNDKKPSVSMKLHLPYFENVPFVAELIEYQRVRHMLVKYIGEEGGVEIKSKRKNAPKRYTKPTGFWQYLEHSDRIHPSFFLHRTVTGRTASANPNAQNFPKRGKIAKAFRRIFLPEEGYRFIEIDLSQAELRIAAWMANETNMLAIYRRGGDIHEATAAAVMDVPLGVFRSWKGSSIIIPDQYRLAARDCITLGDLYALKRYQAKAINFGFLFGMGWRKFMAYAKTEYGLDFTEKEAKGMRNTFFELYPGLRAWHDKIREFVQQYGYVRSIHGALRRLDNVWSDDDGVKEEAKRQGINSPVQRFASDIALMGMVRFARDADWDLFRPMAFIHDAAITQVKIGHEAEGMSAFKFYMENAPLEAWFGVRSPIPMVADVALSNGSLGDMDEQPDVVATEPEWYRPELDE